MQHTAYILRSNIFMQYTAYCDQEDISWINIIHLYLLLSLKFPDSPMDKYNTPVFTSLVEISRLANTLQSVMDMGMEDITSRQWLPLMILGRCEEAPNLNQLAEKCGITRQSTKQLVDKLVEKGYVTLEKSDADKRNMIIVITDKGRRWGAENLDKNMRFVSELYADISERDIKTFAKVQQKLLNKLYVMKEELSNDTNRE